MSNDLKRRLILEGDPRGALTALTKVNKELDGLRQSLSASNAETGKLNRSLSGMRTGGGASFSQAGSALSAVGGAASAVGFGGAGQLTSAVGQVTSAVDAVKGLGTAAASLGPVGLAAGVAIGGLALGLIEVQKAAQRAAEAEKRRTQAQLEAARFLADGGTTDDAFEQIAQRERELGIVLEQIARERQRESELFASEFASNFDRAFGGAQNAIDETLGNLEGQADSLIREIELLGSAIDEGATAANNNARVLELAAEKERELTAERDRASSTLEALIQQERDLQQAFEERARQQGDDRNTQDLRAFQDRLRAEARAQEDLDRALERQAADHENALLAITERGNAQIEQARQALADREANAIRQIADLREQSAAEEARQQAQFDTDNRRRLEDFQRQELRNREDFQRRLRDIDRSFEEQRFDAILNNDVLSLINARRDSVNARQDARGDFRTERDRGREDFATESGRNQEDFERERAERQRALDERITDINRELEEFRRATDEKIADVQRQTTEELTQAQIAYEERLALDAQEREIVRARQEEDRAIAQRRQEEDRATADQRAQEALNAQLERIATSAAAEQSKIDEIDAKVQTLRSGEIALINSLLSRLNAANSAAAGGAIGSGGATGRPIPNRPRDPFGFADGGIVPQGTRGLGMFEGLSNEAVIPLDSARGRQMLGGGGVTINVSPTVMEQDGAQFVSMSDYMALVNAIEDALGDRR